MNCKFLVFTFILNFSCLFSQTYRFYYNVSFKKDSLSKNYINENVILDVNNKTVKFYPEDFIIKDSIRLSTNNYEYSYSDFDYQLIRNKGSEKNTNYQALSPNYYSYSTYDKQNWTVLKETKSKDNLILQKAICNFGGRKWEAWFTPSIPFQEGPYKFRGLPGLIIELKDDHEQYIFKLYKSTNLKNERNTSFYLENLNGLKPILITEKSFKKLKMDYFINPLKDFDSQNMLIKDEKGNIKTLNSKEITQSQQQKIRKYNNPIEINKAIRYPKK